MGTPLHSKWTAFILSIYPEDVSKPPDLLSKLLSHLFLSGVFGPFTRLPVKICWFFWQIEIICRFNLESLDSKKKGDICEVDPSYIWGCFEI